MPAPPFEQNDPLHSTDPARPRFRPPVGIPSPAKDRSRLGFGVSLALHGLVLLLIIAPFAGREIRDAITPTGAGGPGPAGGGGGGSGGSGGVPMTERLRYIQVAPAPPEEESLVPPEEEKVEEEPEQEPEKPVVEIDADIPETNLDVSMKIGIGGGTGSDGSRGTGPGSGGGIGTGQGTGTGSSTGPGTGGGDGEIYSARPRQVFLPPYPRPERVKGTTVVVYFDLDERGRIVRIESNFTRDRAYNRRLREALMGTEFTPAHRADGTPVPSRYPLIFEL